MPASPGRVGYKHTGNYDPTVLTQRPIGARINSANTNVNQLVKSGTNTGTRSTTTFELTGIDTTNSVDYTDWTLEINQAGNVQLGVIQSNTFANPGVVTMPNDFELAFPGSGNLTYLLYPDVVNPIGIQLHPLAQGALTIYRGPTADVEMEIAFLLPGDVLELAVHDMRNIYYQFSIGSGAPEILRWGDAVKPAQSPYARAFNTVNEAIDVNENNPALLIQADNTGITQLTAPGDTSEELVNNAGVYGYTFTVASVDTNVIVNLEGSIDQSNYAELSIENTAMTGASISVNRMTITVNGTYEIWTKAPMKDVRFNIISESGGTAVTIDVDFFRRRS